MIKTFRGQLADAGQDHIRLQTIKGKVGYRITKFQTIGKTLGTTANESTAQIWKKEQTGTPTADINFTDSDLLAVAYWKSHGDVYTVVDAIIFDTEVFNQDIYITNQDTAGDTQPINYYIELEVIPLDDAGAEYTTLKDMRSS